MKKVLIYSVENDEDHRIITMTDSQFDALCWLAQSEYLANDIVFDEIKERDIVDLTDGKEN